MAFAPPFDLLPPLFEGLLVTLKLTVGGALLCTLLAVLAGVGKQSNYRICRGLASTFVELFRGIPALVQLFWFYYVFPLLGVNVNAMTVGVVVLGLNFGAYGAEVVRGALQAVATGQEEAAKALNFTPRQTLWRILFPQAWVRMIPPMTNIYIELMKNSALVSLITISELTFTAKILQADTLRTGAIFSLALLMYFGVSQVISFGMRRLEVHYSRGQDVGGVR